MSTNGDGQRLDPNPDARDPGEPFSHFLQLLRGSVRPLITGLFAAVLAVGFLRVLLTVVLPMEAYTGLVRVFEDLMMAVAGFYFGQRTR